MADTVQAPNQLQTLQALTSLLGGGGTTTTANPGDTAALAALLAQLQSSDYAGLLQSIFNQATQQIPQLQVALGNAMGARSGSNSAVAVALQNLLKQTALEGQKQVADQQLQNQQIQANAAGNVAQATKGTTQQTTNNSNLAQLAGILGLAQAGVQLTGSKNVTDMLNKFIGSPDQGTQQQIAQPAMPAQNFTPMPAQQSQPAFNIGNMMSAPQTIATPINVQPVDQFAAGGFSAAPLDWFQPFDINSVIDNTPQYSAAPADWWQPQDVMSYF